MVSERRRGPASDAFVLVRLTHKYADTLDGVDLSEAVVGDYLRLPSREAALLIVEGWAEVVSNPVASDRRAVSTELSRAEASTVEATATAEQTSASSAPVQSPPGPCTPCATERDTQLAGCIKRPAAQMPI